MSTSEKCNCIDAAHSGLSVARQCKLIQLPRSSYYRPKSKSEGENNQHLMHLIDEEFARRPFTGSRRMTGWLRRQGWQVNRKRVQRLMQRMGAAFHFAWPQYKQTTQGA